MKVVVEKVAVAWDSIRPETIRHSWRKLVPIENRDSSTSQESDLSSPDQSYSEFIDDFRQLDQQLTEADIQDWLESDLNDPGYIGISSPGHTRALPW